MVFASLELKSARGRQFDKVFGGVMIGNVGGTVQRGNYVVVLSTGPKARRREASVEDFPRRSASAWKLLRLALNALYEKGELP